MSFTEIVDTAYGPMLIAKGDHPRGHLLRTTGRADDHAETEMLCDVLRRRGPDAVAIDVGANFGTFTLAFAPLCKQVYAFEPQLLINYMLCGSIALGGHTNVVCEHIALGKFDDDFRMVPQYDYGVAGDFGCTELSGPTAEMRAYKPSGGAEVGQPKLGDRHVRERTLDSYSFNLERIDVLKIDAEGMEFDILLGADATIKRCKPFIMVEAHKSNPMALRGLLEGHGYIVVQQGRDLVACP